MSWIKLVLHPDDPKVAIVAQEAGASKAEAYVAMLRWLFWLDENCGAEGVTVSSSLFRAATGWPNERLLTAFLNEDVDWLVAAGTRYRPTRPDSHFSVSAKLRSQDSARKAKSRIRARSGTDPEQGRTGSGHSPDMSVTRGEETRREETDEMVGGGGGVSGGEVQERGGTVELSPEQIGVYHLLATRPKWLPKRFAWLGITEARDLAVLPTTTPLFARWAMEDIRKRHSSMTNPAGVLVKELRRADPGLIAGITTAAQAEAERIRLAREQAAGDDAAEQPPGGGT